MNTTKLQSILQSFEARLFFVTWLVYALHIVPGGGVNPNRSFDLTNSLVNQRSVAIDADHENTIDKAFKDGHYYQVGMPGPAIAGIPAYLSFKTLFWFVPNKWQKSLSIVQLQEKSGGVYERDITEFFLSTIWITWFTLSLLAAFATVVLYKLLLDLGVSRPNSLIATIAYAFGTPIFFFSTTYFSHAFAASLTVFVLYLLLKVNTEKRATFVALGFTAAAAVLMEYQALVLATGVTIYVIAKYRISAGWPYFAGAAVPLVAVLLYNIAAFGGPFHTPYEFVVGQNAVFHQPGALGFTMPRLDRLWGLTLSRRRGIFIYSPIMILSLVGFMEMLRKRKPPAFDIAVLSVLAAAGVWLWISSFEGWDGSATFGPRLIVSTLPFLAIGLAFSLRFVPKLLSISLLAFSVATNWLGAQFGFAQRIGDPWRRFWSSGINLPAVDILIKHSRSTVLTTFLTHHDAIITALYLLVMGACLLLMARLLSSSKEGLTSV